MIQYDPLAMAVAQYRSASVSKMAAAEIALVVKDTRGWQAAKSAQLMLDRARAAEENDPQPVPRPYGCCLGCRLAGGHS